MPDDFKPTGADADLDRILGDVYTCSRAWEAWEVGTMSEDDFEPAEQTAVKDDLIAWRDAAVQAALAAAGIEPQPAPGLGQRVTSVLLGAGFGEWEYLKTPEGQPAFTVAEGVGATVNLSWAAPDELRAQVLAMFASVLRTSGLEVDDRGRYLYVHEPKRDAGEVSHG